jgi:hypothetical protein
LVDKLSTEAPSKLFELKGKRDRMKIQKADTFSKKF